MNRKKQDARSHIANRRRKLEQEIDRALVEKRGSADICSLIASVEAIRKYEKRLYAPRRRKILLACFLAFAIAPILWSMHARSGNVSIDMSAFATEATFEVASQIPFSAPDATLLEIVKPLAAGSLSLQRSRVTSDSEERRYDNVKITHLSALPRTAIRIKHDGSRCGILEVAEATVGTKLQDWRSPS